MGRKGKWREEQRKRKDKRKKERKRERRMRDLGRETKSVPHDGKSAFVAGGERWEDKTLYGF